MRATFRPRDLLETLAIAGAGGFLFDRAGFPAGWLAGAMAFAAVAALSGRPMYVPSVLAKCFFIALGISIGGAVTPDTLRGIATWSFSVVLVSIAMACVTACTAFYLKRAHGWDTLTAVLAAIPGGLSQVLAFATAQRCDIRAVVTVQTIRVVILSVAVPAGLGLFGLGDSPRPSAGSAATIAVAGELSVLVAAATVAGLGLLRLGFPGGLIFGPMLVSAVLHGGGLITAVLPRGIAIAAMIGLGALSGSRFTNTPPRLLVQYIVASLGSFAVAVVVAGAFALGVSAAWSLSIPDVIVAYAPGGVDAMMILALALHLDPIFVGAHHLTRVFTVSIGLPIVVRCLRRQSGKPKHEPERSRRDPDRKV